MKVYNLVKRIILFTFLLLCVNVSFAETVDPNNDGSQYAYGQNVGWFNFEPNQGPGVTVTTNRLVGYAWVPNIGWVSLSCRNTDSCATVDYEVVNDGSGNLSGYAWSANAGWINFDPNVPGDSNDYGVTIDSNGVFDGWGYGQNIGWIHFQSVSPIAYRVKATVVGLLVLTPNGAEELIDGSVYQITWQTVGDINDVVVEYSTNNGSDWTEVSPSNIDNDDYYDWLVPLEPSTQCLVRVSDLTNPLVSDTSDAVFTLLAPTITVLTPNGGEEIPIDAYYAITWQTQGTVTGTNIWYSIDNGSNWTEVVPPHTGDANSYDWFVPHITSDQALLYVENTADANIYDISDAVFSMIEDTGLLLEEGSWGDDSNGQTDIPDGNYTAFAAGRDFTLALKNDGSITGWGSNTYSIIDDIPAGNDFIAISANVDHALALRSDSTIIGWGRNDSGQTTIPPGSSNYVAIAAGGSFSVAVQVFSLDAWGDDSYGQTSSQPGSRIHFSAVSAGMDHGLSLANNGSLYAWGNDDFNQVSDTPSDSNFVAIAAGWYHNLALRTDGTIVAWGRNDMGQTTVPGGSDFTAIAAGAEHSVALREDGSIMAWGSDSLGQVSTAPFGNGFTAITAGGNHSVAMYVFECPSSLTADLTGDCRVNFRDLSELALQWLGCADPFDPTCVP